MAVRIGFSCSLVSQILFRLCSTASKARIAQFRAPPSQLKPNWLLGAALTGLWGSVCSSTKLCRWFNFHFHEQESYLFSVMRKGRQQACKDQILRSQVPQLTWLSQEGRGTWLDNALLQNKLDKDGKYSKAASPYYENWILKAPFNKIIEHLRCTTDIWINV